MGMRKGAPRFAHGLSKTTEYEVWCGMKSRCYCQNHASYKNYGGRGIRICKRWQNFGNFYTDMGPRQKGYCIERIANDKGYSPSNCKWASRTEQNKNKRNNRMLTFRGKTQSLSAWCRELGLWANSVTRRIDKLGFSIDESFSRPMIRGKQPNANT